MVGSLARRLFPLLLALVVAVPAARAQHPSDVVFVDTVVARVYVELDSDSLARVYRDSLSDHEVPARFTFERDGLRETVASIGFRLRGNTSRASRKKSFKVSFNTFTRGQTWRGLDKLNLNGEHNDPSIARSATAWRLYRSLGIPAPRVGYVALYLNGTYAGLYANVEHLDETFLGRRFGREDGDLFKCLYPADLADLGTDGAAYAARMDGGGRPVYEYSQGDNAPAAFDRLARLATTLNRTPTSNLPAAIEPMLDVNSVLRMLAADVVAGQWDGYWGNMNNYYLAFDFGTQRFSALPYDGDNTLGVDFLQQDWGRKNPYSFGPSTGRPLTTRLLAVPEYRARFTFYLRRLAETSFQASRLAPFFDRLDATLAPFVADDPVYPLDYGYTVDTFHASFRSAAGRHVTYGLLPYVETRRASLLAALDAGNVPPIVGLPAIAPLRLAAGVPFVIAVRVEDEAAPAVVVGAVGGIGEPVERLLVDDGTNGDAVAGDGVYSGRFPAPTQAGTLRVVATATDAAGQTRSGGTVEATVEPGRVTGVVVNEFLASNNGVLRDPAGDAEDAIELYNPTDAPVRLLGYTLTDNLSRPDKWAFPDTTIAPGGFLVVWADEEPEEGPMHAMIKLSAGGEQIGLYNVGVPVDTLAFGSQTTNVSVGRVPDGTGAFAPLVAPTFGRSNTVTSSSDAPEASDALAFTVGPNPTRGPVTVRFAALLTSPAVVEVVDVLGRLMTRVDVASGAVSAPLDVTTGAGVYVVRVRSGAQVSHSTLVRL